MLRQASFQSLKGILSALLSEPARGRPIPRLTAESLWTSEPATSLLYQAGHVQAAGVWPVALNLLVCLGGKGRHGV